MCILVSCTVVSRIRGKMYQMGIFFAKACWAFFLALSRALHFYPVHGWVALTVSAGKTFSKAYEGPHMPYYSVALVCMIQVGLRRGWGLEKNGTFCIFRKEKSKI